MIGKHNARVCLVFRAYRSKKLCYAQHTETVSQRSIGVANFCQKYRSCAGPLQNDLTLSKKTRIQVTVSMY